MLIGKTSDNDNTKRAAEEIARISDQIHQTTRQLLRQLRPPVLDEMSLRRSLYHLIQEFQFAQQGINCRFNYTLSNSIQDQTIRFTVYRLLQELLNNINKHAKAKNIEINLSEGEEFITLSVRDDGVGIPAKLKSGFGLRGIGERVKALSGNWNIHQQQGTTIIVNLPTKLN
jgi:glucose-6-phosphate-specific signal transduction histidine kinase